MNRMPYMVENTGSTARDFAMLERNILSHVKLAVILSLLSSSLLLHARLVPSEDEGNNQQRSGVILGSFQFAAAILSLAAGAWEYYSGYWDLRKARAFLASPQLVFLSPRHL